MTRGLVLLGMAVVAVAGCRTTPKADTGIPAGYVTIEGERGMILSAVAPTGNRIVVRRHTNPPEGTLEFWRDAVAAELIEGKGYAVLESNGVAGKNGRAAWEFLFEVKRTEGEYLYLVLVRVDGSTVFVTEVGGRSEPMQKDLPALRGALR